jgi:hypothetical protein
MFVEVRVAAGECRTFVAGLYVSQTISKPLYFSSHIQERLLLDSAVALINTSKAIRGDMAGFQTQSSAIRGNQTRFHNATQMEETPAILIATRQN